MSGSSTQPATRGPAPVSLSKAVSALLPTAVTDAYCAGHHTTDGNPQVDTFNFKVTTSSNGVETVAPN
jgi:hypothetical protein